MNIIIRSENINTHKSICNFCNNKYHISEIYYSKNQFTKVLVFKISSTFYQLKLESVIIFENQNNIQ